MYTVFMEAVSRSICPDRLSRSPGNQRWCAVILHPDWQCCGIACCAVNLVSLPCCNWWGSQYSWTFCKHVQGENISLRLHRQATQNWRAMFDDGCWVRLVALRNLSDIAWLLANYKLAQFCILVCRTSNHLRILSWKKAHCAKYILCPHMLNAQRSFVTYHSVQCNLLQTLSWHSLHK